MKSFIKENPWLLKCRYVEADSVEDYLKKYYKKNRWTNSLIDSYKKELLKYGYISTSHFDNVTGEMIYWYPK